MNKLTLPWTSLWDVKMCWFFHWHWHCRSNSKWLLFLAPTGVLKINPSCTYPFPEHPIIHLGWLCWLRPKLIWCWLLVMLASLRNWSGADEREFNVYPPTGPLLLLLLPDLHKYRIWFASLAGAPSFPFNDASWKTVSTHHCWYSMDTFCVVAPWC